MTIEDLALLLAVLGGTCVATAWLARRSGAASRDAWLMAALGGGKLALAAVLTVA
ncbi:hypothetical protein H8N03_16775 [Ramlibacter sp. USB13]|uniref:Uncharacterized protein n=1 Tax=Ramlibacter cellulosilyticus TaxID=2764187 RepID=A0A923MSY5_9BURK|nr:hypothetical protein [Ramlibacter cellulosilyticus]MBC5784605.1 hypothetical protein [Ramlibacter cellulosilyticus]